MPIPRGARGVPGEPNRVQLASGKIVGRGTARSMGAREMGYRNEHAYRGHAAGDRNYYRSFINSPQGQRVAAQARANGVSERELQSQVIAARNARPSESGQGRVPGTPGRPAGQAYYEFMEEYDLYDDVEVWSEVSP